jgi:hypothetical protein
VVPAARGQDGTAAVVIPTVVATLAFSCGCTEGLIDDGCRLVACSADVRRSCWWCECVDGEIDPEVCDHASVLVLLLDAV